MRTRPNPRCTPECVSCKGEPRYVLVNGTYEEVTCTVCSGVGVMPPQGGWRDDPDYGPGRSY